MIGIISVVHVFVSHFAVGGGFFLVMTEMKAYRENSPSLLAYVKMHSKFFLLLSVVFGAMTGVAIWFTIQLVHPSGTSALIHSFVWGWAIEWIFFFIEVTSILIYVAMWNTMSKKAHVTIGWIYAASGFFTLAVINAIVAFMLTPGDWLETKDFWDGIFNPSYFPALVTRFLICIALAGVYAFLTASFFKDKEARAGIVRYASLWVLPAVALLPLSLWWYFSVIPESAQTIVDDGISYIALTAEYGVYVIALLFLFVLLGPFFRPKSFTFVQAVLILLLASGVMFTFERVREASRKPYVIHGYMYSHSVRVDDLESTQEAGLMATAKWISASEITEEDAISVGRELFRVSCSSCHTIGGYQNIVPYLADRTEEDLDIILSDLSEFQGFMPPFAGNDEERLALATYLMTLKAPEETTTNEEGE
jgi:mono/diheme cytochrome c family protein